MLNAISRYGPRVIPNTVQIIDQLERQGRLIEGPQIAEFEQAFAARLGGVQATSTSYGRMAFSYILRALNLPRGGEVVFPALTFWVMPEMARVLGLTPVFADVDPVSFNVTVESIEQVVTSRTVAIVPTHLWGLPCDIAEIAALGRRLGVPVIEDCAHALGALYRGQPVGTFGDAAIFSFQTLKPLNGYGGGMAVSPSGELADRVRALAHGEPFPSVKTVKGRLWHGRVLRLATRPDIFKWTLFPLMYAGSRLRWSIDMYFWESIRPLEPLPADYRERMSNVQAAIALEGLKHLDRWTAEQQRHAVRMSHMLGRVFGVRVPMVPPDRTHTFYQYCAYVPSRDGVVDACLRGGVDIETLHVDLCTRLPLFGTASPAPGAEAATHTIQIPVYESLTDDQLTLVADVVADAVASLGHAAPEVVHQS
jgi:dTDP-4-amino-4,6-dideoxygalactose transaminase